MYEIGDLVLHTGSRIVHEITRIDYSADTKRYSVEVSSNQPNPDNEIYEGMGTSMSEEVFINNYIPFNNKTKRVKQIEKVYHV